MFNKRNEKKILKKRKKFPNYKRLVKQTVSHYILTNNKTLIDNSNESIPMLEKKREK